MLTLKDLNAAKKFLKKHYTLPHYSVKQNKLAHRLCGMGHTERGDSIEAMVLSLLENEGYNVYKLGGLKNRCDLWVNDEKIEIKSSLAIHNTPKKGTEYYSYVFKGIKPKFFDRLVLAYVKPTGVELRVLTKTAVYARIRKGGLTEGEHGYSLCHGKNDKMIGQEFSKFFRLTNRYNTVS